MSLCIFPCIRIRMRARSPIEVLSGHPRIKLVEPLGYRDMVAAMQNAWCVVTDSGGLQEEAPALGKPVLVLRDVTERPEAVASGVVELVGTSRDAVFNALFELQQESGQICANGPAGVSLWRRPCRQADRREPAPPFRMRARSGSDPPKSFNFIARREEMTYLSAVLCQYLYVDRSADAGRWRDNRHFQHRRSRCRPVVLVGPADRDLGRKVEGIAGYRTARSVPERPFAIMIPCWKEHEVIFSMLSSNSRLLRYAQAHYFVGVYLNDPLTQDEVRKAQRHIPEHPHGAGAP